MTPRDWNAVREFERQDAFRLDDALTPEKALRLFEGMWTRARNAGALQRSDPLEGLDVVIDVARTVNSLR